MAHGSRIKIDNVKAAPVSWKGLSYGPEQNGREIFGTDIEVGDLLMLMILMSADLDNIELIKNLRNLKK